MQRGGGQGTENAHKSNSLGGSTASGITGASSKANLSHLSLLGQQLNSSFSSSSQKQQPHQQPNPLNLNSGDSMNFPLAMQGHGQHFPQGQQQQQPSSQAQSSVVDSGDASGFSGMQQQNVNALAVPSQGFSGGSQQFLGQQQAQSVESFMTALNTIKEKITQLQACVPYMSQSSQVPNGSTLQVQQQVQQQAAAAISQIAQVAANMFQTGPQQQSAHQAPHQPPRPASHPAPHQSLHQAPHQNPHQPPHQNSHQPAHQNPHQPPHQNPHQPPHPNNPNQQQHAQQQTPVQNQVQSQPQQHHNTQSQHHTQPQHHTHMSQSSPQQQQQPQSHQQTISMPPNSQPFFGVSQGQQSFNFFQGGSGNSASSNGYGNPQGVGANTSGVSMDLPNASSGLPSQMVDGGVPANATAGTGSGMNVAPKGASGGGSGGFGAANQNLGGTNGPNVSSAMVSLSGRQGSPLRSQVAGGGGMGSRGGSNSDISHLTGARPSIPPSSIVRASTPMVEERDDIVGSRDDDDDGDNEALAPGSYDLVELDAIEILAEHTHFCEMCGKGFKRDANLRMHMRGHGDEYKTPAALARPDKASHELSAVRQRRYSCPYGGCKRNKKHRKFQPLKTMLCVKNHYRRSHCPKILTCNKCKTKKFSVVADLKTHEKHCGCDKWQCSCGTTFSRKDKLIGHIGLFVGHKAAFGDMDATSAMDGVEMTPANPPSGQNAGSSGGSGYALSAAGNMSAGSQPNVGCGSGMGLNETSMQGLSSRGNTQGGSSLTMPKDGSVLVPDNSSSSDSFPSAGLSFPNLFSTSFSADQ